jgi:dynein heavy chain
MSIQPKDTGGAGESPEQQVSNKCLEYYDKMKNDVDFNIVDVRKILDTRPAPLIKPLNEKDKPDRGLKAPLNIFLYQEIQRMVKIIAIVKRSLVDMRDAIEGTIIMSPKLAKGIDSI